MRAISNEGYRGGALGGEVSEREGSRVAVVLFNEVRIFHRTHPTPTTDKGAVSSIRKWFVHERRGVRSSFPTDLMVIGHMIHRNCSDLLQFF